MLERDVKRYAAYFKGWCQTFGEHESLADHDNEIYWLLSDKQAGFVLPPDYLRQLYRAVLLHDAAPPGAPLRQQEQEAAHVPPLHPGSG